MTRNRQAGRKLQRKTRYSKKTLPFVSVWGNVHPSNNQLRVINKGLKYVEKPRYFPKSSVLEGLQAFKRRMRLKLYFANKDENNARVIKKFRNPSNFQPPANNVVLENYLKNLDEKLSVWMRNKNELTRNPAVLIRNKILKRLRKDRTLVFKKQDKGSSGVIIDKNLYVQKGLEFLENAAYFQEIQHDETEKVASVLSELLKQGRINSEITQKMWEFLDPVLNNCMRLANLYFLPKMHKDPPKVRPIVSANNTPTERIGIFLDHFLQPLVEDQFTYLKDTKEVIRKIESQPFPQDCVLMTLDVTSLYTNIDHDLALELVSKRLALTENKTYAIPRPSTSFLSKLTQFLINNNIFEFNNKIYKQTIGLAMGNVAAPAISDVVLFEIEKELLKVLGENTVFYGRYRDDILLILKNGEKTLEEVLDHANSLSELIKFEGNASCESATFLDLVIYKGSRFEGSKILDLKIKEKPFGSNAYLHRSSCHPSHVFKGLIKGEIIRSIRNNSDETEHLKHLESLSRTFLSRGYSKKELNAAYASTLFENRKIYLEQNTKKENTYSGNMLPYSLQWFPGCTELKRILNQNWDLIQNDPVLSKIFPESPKLVFKKGINTADYLVSAKLN